MFILGLFQVSAVPSPLEPLRSQRETKSCGENERRTCDITTRELHTITLLKFDYCPRHQSRYNKWASPVLANTRKNTERLQELLEAKVESIHYNYMTHSYQTPTRHLITRVTLTPRTEFAGKRSKRKNRREPENARSNEINSKKRIKI